MSEQCTHPDFEASVTVNRLENTGIFVADICITCSKCHIPFQFLGLPMGLNLSGAAVSVDRTEAHLAIAPIGEVRTQRADMPTGFRIREQRPHD